jgi:uncharacterized protein (DUF433 family)
MALDRITFDPNVCGGQPTVRGLRIPVGLIVRHVAQGQTAQDVVAEYPELEPEDIRQAPLYGAWAASGRTEPLPASVKFIGDINISPRVVAELRARGHDVVRADAFLPPTAADPEIARSRATAVRRSSPRSSTCGWSTRTSWLRCNISE